MTSVISRTIDKLPKWAQVTIMVLAIPGSIYCIVRYGFWHFALRMIFSP